MSKKLREMIRENQRRNGINLKMFSVAVKSTEESFKENKNNKSTKQENTMNNKKNNSNG